MRAGQVCTSHLALRTSPTSSPVHICITRARTSHTPPRLQDRKKVRTKSSRGRGEESHMMSVSQAALSALSPLTDG